jgi:hypothetical protein
MLPPLHNDVGGPTRFGSVIMVLSMIIVIISTLAFVPLSGFGMLGAAMMCGASCHFGIRLLAAFWMATPVLLIIAVIGGMASFRNPRWPVFSLASACLAATLVSFILA